MYNSSQIGLLRPGKPRKRVSIIVSSFCHVSMLRRNIHVSAVQQRQILLLRNKIDAGNNASRVAKLGNIGETCTLQVFLETRFLVLPGLYCHSTKQNPIELNRGEELV